MDNSKKKRTLYVSGVLSIVGLLMLLMTMYFLIQTVRETFYQKGFESRYEFISLEKDGEVDPVQVFHGVKVNTFLEDPDGKGGNIIFEIKDEPEAKLKGFEVNSDGKGMNAYADAIQYKVMVEKETGNESFIVAMQTRTDSAKYRTFSINENGVVKKSSFTLDSKSKLETQWMSGISGEKHGYYTNLPYQDGSVTSLIVLSVLGVITLIGGMLLGRTVLQREKGKAA